MIGNDHSRRSVLKSLGGGAAAMGSAGMAQARDRSSSLEESEVEALKEIEAKELEPNNHRRKVKRIESKPGVKSLQNKFERRGYSQTGLKLQQITEGDEIVRYLVQWQYEGTGIENAYIQYNDLEKLNNAEIDTESFPALPADSDERGEFLSKNNILAMCVKKSDKHEHPTFESFGYNGETGKISTHVDKFVGDRYVSSGAADDSVTAQSNAMYSGVPIFGEMKYEERPTAPDGINPDDVSRTAGCGVDSCLTPYAAGCDYDVRCLLSLIGTVLVVVGSCAICAGSAGFLTFACAICLGSALQTVHGLCDVSDCYLSCTCVQVAFAGSACNDWPCSGIR